MDCAAAWGEGPGIPSGILGIMDVGGPAVPSVAGGTGAFCSGWRLSGFLSRIRLYASRLACLALSISSLSLGEMNIGASG